VRYAEQMAMDKYPPGTTVVMVADNNPDSAIAEGTKGTVRRITQDGLLQVVWSTGANSFVDMVRDRIEET